MVLRCCYITVDSARASSQSGFCSCRLFIYKKPNIMQIMTETITICIYFIFYHRAIVEQDHFMTLFLSYANTVLWCTRCKIHRFVAAPVVPVSGHRCKGYVPSVLRETPVYFSSPNGLPSRETRKEWPLLTVETELRWMRTQRRQMKGVLSWLVC